uniref:AlNc14C109G6340 protein n=1 Tax=Albugo laibachii Nc14 TaxID=890382 RepID=F0WID9_9STRA|nr:AlNc14C109G6340 [Albugo laibachii Nc14]|eukprot:CCA21020.1 AlNc14C109G6340 [Albugo laibachii Nc14]
MSASGSSKHQALRSNPSYTKNSRYSTQILLYMDRLASYHKMENHTGQCDIVGDRFEFGFALCWSAFFFDLFIRFCKRLVKRMYPTCSPKTSRKSCIQLKQFSPCTCNARGITIRIEARVT